MKNREKRFKQIVHFVEDKILSGEYRVGDKIPSINAWGIRFGLSRSSIFLAMDELKSRGLIEAEPSIGYYVSSCEVKIQEKVLLLFNEFTAFKEDLYNAFMAEIGDDASADLLFHNYNRNIFETLLRNANGKYTTYVVMPGKFQGLRKSLEHLNGHVILVDHFHPELKPLYPSVGQDFEEDTYQALLTGVEQIRKYKTITLVQKEGFEPEERFTGISRFCKEHGLRPQLLSTMKGKAVEKGHLYITATDRELVDILKKADAQKLAIGQDYGVISYNETPMKEILCGGITTLSTDFKQMGRTLAALVKEKKMQTIANPCTLLLRGSI